MSTVPTTPSARGTAAELVLLTLASGQFLMSPRNTLLPQLDSVLICPRAPAEPSFGEPAE